MSLPFNLNIPFASNAPANDQPLMQTNTNSTASFVAVDHVAFGTTTGFPTGYHTVIHQTPFSTTTSNPSYNNPPVMPTPVGSVGELVSVQMTIPPSGAGNTDEVAFFQSGGGRYTQLTGILSGAGNQTSITAGPPSSGYTPLIGGLVLQWGTFTKTSGSQTITFPTAFPNNCLNVQVTGLGLSTQLVFYAYWCNTFTTTTFNFNSNGVVNNTTWQYLALGY